MKSKIYRLEYIELLDNEVEREGSMIIKTKDIELTVAQFSRNRNIIKMEIIQKQ